MVSTKELGLNDKKLNKTKVLKRRSSSVKRSNAVKKIQRKFKSHKKKPKPNKSQCRKKLKQCIQNSSPLRNFSFSNSNSSTRSSNPSFYEKLANKHTRCKKQYKICRGRHARSRSSKLTPGFYNK
jgi:hypothetical protein